MDDQIDGIVEAHLVEQIQDLLEDEAIMMDAIARWGGRIMAMLEDGGDIGDDDDEALVLNWESVTVNINEYRLMGDPSFRRHFRLTKPCFEALLLVVGGHLVDRNRVRRIRTTLDHAMLMVLWILANPDTFRSVALRLGCQPGTVHFHYCYIIEALREMAPQYIRWPDQAQRAVNKVAFEEYCGIPGIVGCMDGTLIPIIAPVWQKNRYRDRHDQHSLNILVVCDPWMKVIAIHIGETGSMHDQRVLRRSNLFRKLIHPDPEFMLPDEHILGDGDYTILDTLLIPFRNVGNLTAAQRAYNRCHCRCRSTIEHAHGKCFGQWRRLKYLHAVNLEIAADHIMACYVLYNFMILNGEVMLDLEEVGDQFLFDDGEKEEEENAEEAMNLNEHNQIVRERRELGIEKRWHLVHTLFED